MATTTTNLKLVKPDLTDFADIRVLNGNMDILDGAVGGLDYVKDVTKSDTGLTFTKKDDTVVNVPLDYMPTTGGNFTGDITVKNQHPIYLLEQQTQDFEKYTLSAIKYSDGTLKQEIRYKHLVAGQISSVDNITFLIPFKDVERITLSTGCYSTLSEDDPYNDWVWSVAKLTATGCTTKASGYYSAPCYVINGFWK